MGVPTDKRRTLRAWCDSWRSREQIVSDTSGCAGVSVVLGWFGRVVQKNLWLVCDWGVGGMNNPLKERLIGA